MARAGAKLTGDKGLERLLRELPGRVANKVNRQAVTKATTPVLAAVKSAAPVDKGNLRRAMIKKVYSRKGRTNGLMGANANFVGPDGEQPFRYDHLVEYGHVAPDGTVTPPNPYMRAGWDASVSIAAETYREQMAAGIDAEAKKLGGK